MATATTTLPLSPPVSTPAVQRDELSRIEIWSIIFTVGIGVVLVIIAYISAGRYSAGRGWVIGLAASVGALGGLVHEVAQSGGKIFFFERKLDGFYIGSVAGAILGSVAGLLAIQGLISEPISDPANAPTSTRLIYQALLAGIALKGVTEAAGGQALPPGSESVTPGQAMAAEASVAAIAAGSSKPKTPADLPPLGPVPQTLPADLD